MRKVQEEWVSSVGSLPCASFCFFFCVNSLLTTSSTSFRILLGFLGYFVLGAYHNYTTYGATGWDAIPHRDMWRDLPWVVSDLFRSEHSPFFVSSSLR